MTRIKLCGIRREEDAAVANELAPDYVGFVFAKKSKRYVTPEKAEELRKILDPGIKTVGVFVKEVPELILELLKDNIIDAAQLHGGEDDEYVRRLKERTIKPIFQAFRIDSAEDVERANNSSADMVLLDAGKGGTGQVFDWNLLKDIKRPYILAGGLNTDNVAMAVETLKPYGVDVSSGIETEGVKDPEKMKLFVKLVREQEERN